MALAKITGSGLSSIALLVAVLWACIVGEQIVLQRANRELGQAMTEIRQLQSRKRAEPASTPAPRHPVRPTLG